jgi:hypothetical protein
MKVLRFMTLARRAHPHIVLDDLPHVRKMKVTAKPVHRALDTLVPLLMDGHQQLLEKC